MERCYGGGGTSVTTGTLKDSDGTKLSVTWYKCGILVILDITSTYINGNVTLPFGVKPVKVSMPAHVSSSNTVTNGHSITWSNCTVSSSGQITTSSNTGSTTLYYNITTFTSE